MCNSTAGVSTHTFLDDNVLCDNTQRDPSSSSSVVSTTPKTAYAISNWFAYALLSNSPPLYLKSTHRAGVAFLVRGHNVFGAAYGSVKWEALDYRERAELAHFDFEETSRVSVSLGCVEFRSL